MKTIRILYCDDQERARKSYKLTFDKTWEKVVTDYGLSFSTCADIIDGGAATLPDVVDITAVGSYDILLLDIQWGTGKEASPHGVTLCKLIRERYPELPIVVFSGHVKTTDFKELIPCGIAAYMAKRDEPQNWIAVLRDAFEKSYFDRNGVEVYKLLRSLLTRDANEWVRVANVAATDVWRQEMGHEKWNAFWNVFDRQVGPKYLYFPFKNMSSSFERNDLFLLGLNQSMRGHLEHVLNVYFLGVALMHSLKDFRLYVNTAAKRLLKDAYAAEREGQYWDWFQFAWLAAATLHDTAYSLESLPNVWRLLDELQELYSFSVLPSTAAKPRNCALNWDTPAGGSARNAFSYVLQHLETRFDSDWIVEHSTFVDKYKEAKCNHGVSSALLLLREVDAWKELWSAEPGFYRFLQWTATAVALHAMKHPGQKQDKHIALQSDPLSALLMICDELQVWNRERPDLTERRSPFHKVELDSLLIAEGCRIQAVVKYFPFRGVLIDTDNHYKPLYEQLSKDALVLKKYLRLHPYSLHVKSVIERSPDPLPSIDVE